MSLFSGPDGAKGEKGDRGDRGEKGERGPIGPKGESGFGSSSRGGARGEKVWTFFFLYSTLLAKRKLVLEQHCLVCVLRFERFDALLTPENFF